MAANAERAIKKEAKTLMLLLSTPPRFFRRGPASLREESAKTEGRVWRTNRARESPWGGSARAPRERSVRPGSKRCETGSEKPRSRTGAAPPEMGNVGGP